MWDGKEGYYPPPRQSGRSLRVSLPRSSDLNFQSLASSGPLALEVSANGDISGDPGLVESRNHSCRGEVALGSARPALSPNVFYVAGTHRKCFMS